jgi:histo-blood group ABO system transferase
VSINIGLIVIATNKYIEFVPQLVASVEKNFLKNHNVEIFLFTNQQFKGNVTVIPTEHRPWPWMTLGRYHLIQTLKEYPKKDYYYYIDADMLVVGDVSDEILGDRVAAIHGKFKKKAGNFDRNPLSLAYVPPEISNPYFCGGFQGGSKYIEDAEQLAKNIDTDFNKDIVALWHDESHWNRYCLDNPPTVILPYTYCDTKTTRVSKIVIVRKDSKEVRS